MSEFYANKGGGRLNILNAIDEIVWGPITLVLLVGTGIFLTIRLKFLPIRNLFSALKSVFSSESRKAGGHEGDVSPFAALMTALASTIGTGNIVGVATAMVQGGPGALVWMWIAAFFGITTKFAECALAIKYRTVNDKGEMAGGPMYTLKRAFPIKKVGTVLAALFAIFTVFASFGIGNMAQGNSISSSVEEKFGVSVYITGIVLSILVIVIIIGGIKSISKVSSFLVPIMAGFYIISALVVIIINYENIPSGISQIFTMAFNPQAVSGGVTGVITVTILQSMRYGVARGVFSNEAGLGSAAITAPAAKTNDHIKQGYINMCGTFIDTIIVCTMTGLVIASSGMLGSVDANGELLVGAKLTISAFESVIGPIGGYIVTIGLVMFAFSTILGWEYNGEKALEYLFKKPIYCYIYRGIFAIVAFVGATTSLEAVWSFSDIANGLMAIPNLIGLIALSSVLAKDTFKYDEDNRKKLLKTK